jgi:hypothetical protein
MKRNQRLNIIGYGLSFEFENKLSSSRIINKLLTFFRIVENELKSK